MTSSSLSSGAGFDLLWQTGRLLSLLGGGLLAGAAGIRAVYLSGGLLLLAAATAGALGTRTANTGTAVAQAANPVTPR